MESISFSEQDPNTTASLLSNPDPFLSSHLQKRYTTISIPASYGGLNAGPAPGTIAGIVLGTVGGVVIILYLTFLALNPDGLARGTSSSAIDEEVVVRSRRPSSHRQSEIIEVVEERGRRPSYRRRASPVDDRIIVEESISATTDSRDIIEVVEESSGISSASPLPSRRARSRRSGVRSVNPYDYGGGSP